MGNPHHDLKCVHLAGTNGKGSTSLIIAGVLVNAGYRVGRFNSPHLHSYCERITVNSRQINGNRFESYLNRMEDYIRIMQDEGYPHLTEFEILTAVAFQYFKDEAVDIAVLETGLGGIYDSTNVIIPVVSVITGVDYDHTRFLGDTLEEIAWNKAGIIKEDTPVIVGDMDDRARQVIIRLAGDKNAKTHSADQVKIKRILDPGINGQTVNIESTWLNLRNVNFSLLGDYQLRNLATALTALEVLRQKGYNLADENIIKTLARLEMPGRMEIIKKDPLVIIDVAHNPQAAGALAESLDSLLPGQKKVLVCGMVDDKDIHNTIKYLGKNTTACVVTRPEGHRNRNWRKVKEEWLKIFASDVFLQENIPQAVELGRRLLQKNEYLVVTGSFYVLNQARKYLINS